MSAGVPISELAIVVNARNHNPTILNPDFLRHNGIVDSSWELSGEEPPITTPAISRVAFANGVSIVAETNTLTFAELLDSGEPRVPDIAGRFVRTLPHVDYRAVGINPRGHLQLGADPTLPRRFITEHLLAPGPWRSLGVGPLEAEVQLRFFFENVVLNFSVEDVGLRGDPDSRVLMMWGNAHHEIHGSHPTERQASLMKCITDWRADLELFEEVSRTLLVKWKQADP